MNRSSRHFYFNRIRYTTKINDKIDNMEVNQTYELSRLVKKEITEITEGRVDTDRQHRDFGV